MSNENKQSAEATVEKKEKTVIKKEISVVEFEQKIETEEMYLRRDGMSKEKAATKAREIVAKEYVAVTVPVDYSNWAGQNNK